MGYLGLLAVMGVLLALVLYCWDLLVERREPSGSKTEPEDCDVLAFPKQEQRPRSVPRNEIEERIEKGFPYAYIVVRNPFGRVELVHIEHLVCGNDVSILPFRDPIPGLERFLIGSVVWIAKKTDGYDIWTQPEDEMSEMQWVEWRAAKRILLSAKMVV